MPLVPAGFFVVRSPLLPIEEFLALAEAPSERLRALVTRPEVHEAIRVASSSLAGSLGAWLEAPASERGRRVERSLAKYVARLCARATPFGLFAGCASGRMSAAGPLALGPRARYGRHSRLDCDYVFSLVEELTTDPGVRARLRYRLNDSAYAAAGRIRYVEGRSEKGGRVYQLSAVDSNEYIEALVARASGGATVDELAARLVELDPEVTPEEARLLVDDLVAVQVLVPELQPLVTGREPVPAITAELASIDAPAAQRAALALTRAQDGLSALDRGGLGQSLDAYQAIAAELEGLPAKIEPDRLFQVDLYKPVAGTLSAAVVKEVIAGADLLRQLTPTGPERTLEEFITRFRERWEGAEVPLVDVLDEEAGIGFDAMSGPGADTSPLLQGLGFAGEPDQRVRWGEREQHLLTLVARAERSGARVIELAPEDVKRLSSPAPAAMPESVAAHLSIAARTPEEQAAGRFQIYLRSVTGPSGASLLGRFCHGDEALAAHVAELMGRERDLWPDALLAEIVHLPQGRLGNVILRPVLRDYEIPFLGRSGAPAERQIPLQDLLVSVHAGGVRLRSRRLGRTVRPCLTNAHNFRRPDHPGLYRFLCLLGGPRGFAWSWGPLERAPFLPRVQKGRIVLSIATWNLDASDCARPLDELVQAHRWPRFVGLARYDNVLPLDLTNPLFRDVLAHELKGAREATLVELYPGPDELPLRGPEGRFVSEIVLPLLETEPPPAAERKAEPAPAPEIRRRLLPGEDWLYAKLYTGAATADRLLVEVVAPLLAELRQAGTIDGWFFLRYGDPDWHVRLRLHGAPDRLLAEALPALTARARPLLDDGRLARLVLDTYHREVERYGGPEGMELAEALFCADSDAVLAIVENLSAEEGADARWRLALVGIERLLEDLGLDAAARARVLDATRQDFAREHRVGVDLKRRLGDRFRKERAALEALFAPGAAAEHDLGLGLTLLAERSTRLRPLAARLRALEAAGRLASSVEDLAHSFVHMHANRLLRSSQRAHELVLYDFLSRLHESWARRHSSQGS